MRFRMIIVTYSHWNTHSNKTETLAKKTNMYILAIGILNHLFIRGSYTQIKFSKKMSSQWQKPFPLIGLFCTPHSIYLNIGF